MNQTLESFDIADAYYDKDYDAVFLVYHKPAKTHDEFVKIYMQVLKIFSASDTNKFIVDTRKMGVIPGTTRNWIISDFVPEMLRISKSHNLFYGQLIDPLDNFSKSSALAIRLNIDKVAQVEQFTQKSKMLKRLREL